MTQKLVNQNSLLIDCRDGYLEKCGTIKRLDLEILNLLNPVMYSHQLEKVRGPTSKILEKLGIKNPPELIKGVRGTSNKDHTPENLARRIKGKTQYLC